jgi:tetratricopeptide (TPR) repeat protein
MSDGNGKSTRRKETFQRGLRLLHEGRAAEAAPLLEDLYEKSPDDVEVALNLGGAYILQHRFGDAVEVLERAARLAPGNENVWVNLAAARLGPLAESDEAQQEGAIAAYEKALQANAAVPNVHYMLGLIYRSRRDNLRAAAHFTRALEQDPGDNDARRMLSAIAAESMDRTDR